MIAEKEEKLEKERADREKDDFAALLAVAGLKAPEPEPEPEEESWLSIKKHKSRRHVAAATSAQPPPAPTNRKGYNPHEMSFHGDAKGGEQSEEQKEEAEEQLEEEEEALPAIKPAIKPDGWSFPRPTKKRTTEEKNEEKNERRKQRLLAEKKAQEEEAALLNEQMALAEKEKAEEAKSLMERTFPTYYNAVDKGIGAIEAAGTTARDVLRKKTLYDFLGKSSAVDEQPSSSRSKEEHAAMLRGEGFDDRRGKTAFRLRQKLEAEEEAKKKAHKKKNIYEALNDDERLAEALNALE